MVPMKVLLAYEPDAQSPHLGLLWRRGITWFIAYLEGQGDLVSRLITPITHIVTLVLPLINLVTKSP